MELEGRKEGRRKELAVLTAVAVSYRVFKSDECYARAQRKRERERETQRFLSALVPPQ